MLPSTLNPSPPQTIKSQATVQTVVSIEPAMQAMGPLSVRAQLPWANRPTFTQVWELLLLCIAVRLCAAAQVLTKLWEGAQARTRMRVLAHLCTAPAAAQQATTAAAPIGTAGAAVLQDPDWNGLILKMKPTELVVRGWVKACFSATAPPPWFLLSQILPFPLSPNPPFPPSLSSFFPEFSL